MIFQFLLPLLPWIGLSIGLTVVAYLLMPKAKQPKPETRDLENPTADAGRPIVVVFGTKTVQAPNILWYGEKTTRNYTVSV